MKHFVTIVEIAPPSPPCFYDRLSWIEYLVSAAKAQRESGGGSDGGDERGPLVFEKGKPVRFDYTLDYCTDCEAGFRARMGRKGLCRPDFVRRLEAAPALAPVAERACA